MTKYDSLGGYLNRSNALQITLSFKDVERILGFKLPETAKLERAWWGNRRTGSARQSDAWMHAGWQVFFADMHRREITFVKYKLVEAAAN